MYFADAAVVKIPIINEPKQLRDRILDDFFENIPLVAACRRKLPRRVNLIGCKLEIRGAWVECPTIREEKSRHGMKRRVLPPGVLAIAVRTSSSLYSVASRFLPTKVGSSNISLTVMTAGMVLLSATKDSSGLLQNTVSSTKTNLSFFFGGVPAKCR